MNDTAPPLTDPQYPLYPRLPDPGATEAKALLASFREQMAKIADETIGRLYSDVLPYIESDAWTNFKNALMDGLCNYGNRKVVGDYDYKKIRRAILEENREEIIADLNQDNLARIAELESQIEAVHRNRY
ncbi:MAG: hypothetical protein WC718_00030 [Phycisphaerales bacterium]|jgi:hypothetical protein